MTTIVGVQHATGVTIAADLRTTADRYYDTPGTPKIVRRGAWLIAAAGDAAVSDRLVYITPWPDVRPGREHRDILKHVVPLWTSKVRAATVQALVAVHGLLFQIGEDGSVIPAETGDAFGVGSGSHYALGALATGASVEDAVKIAARFDPYTSSTVTVETQDRK